MKKIIFTQEQTNDILNEYQNEHLSTTKIAKNYGVCKSVISRILKENNVEIIKHPHKYIADYRIFQTIDSAEKAYWLGFIAADGCVYVREHNATVRISIHEKDYNHLEKFRDFMKSNVNITKFINASGFSKDAPTPMCAISFNSEEMAQDLINLGIVPKKSLVLEPPKIEPQYYLPYILGYFDGDGTIYKTNHDTEFTVGFIGSLQTISWINEITGLNAALEQRRKDSETYCIRCGGTNKPYNLLKPLYDSTNVHLDRKYELFKELENSRS